jgi:hypothetical protein
MFFPGSGVWPAAWAVAGLPCKAQMASRAPAIAKIDTTETLKILEDIFGNPPFH